MTNDPMKGICFWISIALTVLTRAGLVAAQPHAAPGTLLWQQNLNGTAANSFGEGLSVAVDNQGNLVAAGFTQTLDFTVAKFDGDGTLLWQQNLNGTANSVDQALSVAVDNEGNVVAGGFTRNKGTSVDFTVAKFDGGGTLLWQHNLNGTAPNSFDEAVNVAVDSQGNVIAAGYTQNTGSSFDFTVAKFDRDGTLLWQQNLNGTAANSGDEAFSVAVDFQGNVVAAGITKNTATSEDFTVAKFDRDGTLLWQRNLNGTADRADAAVSVAVDNQGNVVAAGSTQNTGTSLVFTVAKFDRDGTLVWQQNLGNSYGFATSVVVDTQGNVVAAGVTSTNFTVAKFDRHGTLLWRQNLSGTANRFGGTAFSVVVDNQRNVVAAGSTENTGTARDFTVAKFDRDGTLLWQQNLNGTANRDDQASSIAVDNQGNVVATGITQRSGGTFYDFTVAKFGR